jgi:protein O-GlcNAc transferase
MVIPLLLALSVGMASDDAAQARAAADLARSLLGAGRPAEALVAARRAAALDPKNAEGDLLAGYALLETGLPEEALASFRRAAAANPGSVEAHGGLAMAYGALGDPRAEKEFASVFGSVPKDSRYRYRYAEYLWLTGETDRGNREMERAIRLAPSDPELKLNYGMKLHKQGRFIDAARELNRARQAGAREPSLPFFLGSAELENGHFAEAERSLREAIPAEPERGAARQVLGKLLLLTGRPGDARRELALAASLDRGSAPVQLDLGRAAEALGDLDAAEAAYRQALSLQPNLSRGHYLLGALLSRRRRLEEARQEMAIYDKAYQEEQALLFSQSSLRVEINLGSRELREGRYADALARFRRHPDNVEALRGAAAALSRLGRHTEAVATLERALILSPEDRRLRYELGRERQGDRAP